MLVGGGTSIMPRTAPVLYDFVEADNGEYLEAAEAVFRIFDRQDWLRANRARARIKVFVDKFGIDELRRQVDEERKGDWVKERDFDVAKLRFDDDEEAVVTKLPMAQRLRAARTATAPTFQRWAEDNVEEAAPGRLQHRPGERHPRRPLARSSSAASRRSCATSAAATRARRSARTSSCAGCATRRPTPSGSGCARSGSPIRAPTRSSTRSPAPAPTPASSASPLPWGSTVRYTTGSRQMDITDPLTQEDPHQDVRLPERLRPAPHRQHRLLRRVDQGRRQDDPGVRRPHRRPLRGRRGRRVRPAPEDPPAREARARTRSSAGSASTRPSATTARRSTQFAERVGLAEFEERAKDLSIPVEFNLENIEHFIDWSRREPYQVIRGEGECAV